MQSISEKYSAIPDFIHRRRIGYFSIGTRRAGSRQEIDSYIQENLVSWREAYGEGQPYVHWDASLDQWQLEWHRPKTSQELAYEARVREFERERLISQRAQYEQERRARNMASQQAALHSQLAMVSGLAAMSSSQLSPSYRSAEPSPKLPVRVPRRQMVPPTLWTRLKVFAIALLTGASPFRVYWEIKHALRIQD